MHAYMQGCLHLSSPVIHAPTSTPVFLLIKNACLSFSYVVQSLSFIASRLPLLNGQRPSVFIRAFFTLSKPKHTAMTLGGKERERKEGESSGPMFFCPPSSVYKLSHFFFSGRLLGLDNKNSHRHQKKTMYTVEDDTNRVNKVLTHTPRYEISRPSYPSLVLSDFLGKVEKGEGRVSPPGNRSVSPFLLQNLYFEWVFFLVCLSFKDMVGGVMGQEDMALMLLLLLLLLMATTRAIHLKI